MGEGTVKWFKSAKGYGFINPDTGEDDVFVHRSALAEANMVTLIEGQRVSFDVIGEHGKTAAGNLKVA